MVSLWTVLSSEIALRVRNGLNFIWESVEREERNGKQRERQETSCQRFHPRFWLINTRESESSEYNERDGGVDVQAHCKGVRPRRSFRFRSMDLYRRSASTHGTEPEKAAQCNKLRP